MTPVNIAILAKHPGLFISIFTPGVLGPPSPDLTEMACRSLHNWVMPEITATCRSAVLRGYAASTQVTLPPPVMTLFGVQFLKIIIIFYLIIAIIYNINGTGYTGLHYINYMLLVVPNTEAALLCCSAMDTGEGMGGTGDHVSCSADAC